MNTATVAASGESALSASSRATTSRTSSWKATSGVGRQARLDVAQAGAAQPCPIPAKHSLAPLAVATIAGRSCRSWTASAA